MHCIQKCRIIRLFLLFFSCLFSHSLACSNAVIHTQSYQADAWHYGSDGATSARPLVSGGKMRLGKGRDGLSSWLCNAGQVDKVASCHEVSDRHAACRWGEGGSLADTVSTPCDGDPPHPVSDTSTLQHLTASEIRVRQTQDSKRVQYGEYLVIGLAKFNGTQPRTATSHSWPGWLAQGTNNGSGRPTPNPAATVQNRPAHCYPRVGVLEFLGFFFLDPAPQPRNKRRRGKLEAM